MGGVDFSVKKILNCKLVNLGCDVYLAEWIK